MPLPCLRVLTEDRDPDPILPKVLPGRPTAAIIIADEANKAPLGAPVT
jgi:hypothetical protein